MVGGDTTKGPLSITISAKGIVKSGRFLTRSGALEGDLIVVSGNIGDGAIGLALKRKQIKLPLPLSFIESLQKTEPRCKLGLLLTNKKHKASSCLDISDGLIQDLMHILTNSNCGASINIDQLPLSAPHQAMLALDKIAALDSAKYALFGGDDYELLFTISKENFEHLTSLNTDTQLTVIGEITTSKRAKVIFESEQNNEIAQLLNKNRHQAGWDHFAI
ncbi:MAG TPA: thiamine-monophosphate kinase [Psychromonas hadalis]|nr:thiamine-monophosphate kinase [Psychromonas hadalis]